MAGARKYNTYNKTRPVLFSRSYIGYSIKYYLRNKYKIDENCIKPQLNLQPANKRSTPEISRLSRTLNLNYKSIWQYIVLNKKLSLNPKINADQRIKIYLKLESEMIFISIARLDRENIVNEDYERAVLSPAIERVAGNYLKNIDEDFVFDQRLADLKREYTRLYYKVAYRYKLPTPRLLAFILRLITPS